MSARDLKICVVGAGMSGLLMGVRLKQRGLTDFRIFEKDAAVGGTWRDNRYPGLSCDVPSFFYSYSFEPNPDWTHRFAPGPEIRDYFEKVAEKHDLHSHLSLGEEVVSARYDPSAAQWNVALRSGETLAADVLITATGALHQRKCPRIPGLESFEGRVFHSADWDHEAELEGRRIGVVGTGSSAVQMMAPLSEVASHLTMFQRTPQWIAPVGNREYSESERAWTRRLPLLGALTRWWYKRTFEAFSVGVVKDGRRRRLVAESCRKHLASVRDPELRRKLTPDYEPMCKRLIMSTTFYPTLMKDHVHLETSGIERIEPRGVVTKDGALHELDVLVLATGFEPFAWGVDPLVGEHGLSLKEAWAQGTRAYYSVAMPGFPNFFMLVGPNSPIGNISLIDISERQADYILDCVEELRQGRARSVAPTAEATAAFHERLLEAMKDTVWVTGCNSWYLDEDGVPVTWPWSAQRFHRDMRRPKLSEFDLRPA